MEFIEEIMNKCQKNNKVDILARVLALIFFFALLPIMVVYFNGSKLFGLIFFCGAFLMPVVGYILGMKIGEVLFRPPKLNFSKTKLYKKLKKAGYLNEFMDTINQEIDQENTIKFYDKFLGVGLLMTETWFVFIDIADPIFVKTNEIVKISDEISSKSRHFMCLELKNKTYIRIDELSCDDIEKEITLKYPDIEIGTGIIEE